MASVADIGALTRVDDLYAEAERQFADWDVVKDVVDEMIDLSLNYRQSGHPGGSRSKVHLFLALLLSGAMRWDIRRPWRPFADRFVLSAGHTVPLVYATLAVLNGEATPFDDQAHVVAREQLGVLLPDLVARV